MSTSTVRWGIIGPGRIAGEIAESLPLSDGGVLHAVASRSADRARAFARAHGARVAYGAYGDLLDDPDVDAVHIATPHRQHHGLALAAIAAGKHVLVEKSFTCTVAGALQVTRAARDAGVFCMEAMWTRFQPAIVRLRELIDAHAIGEVRSVRADLGLRRAFDADDRLWDPAQGGGALLDLGVYPVSFVQSVLGGALQVVDLVGATADNGVDAEAALLLRSADGRAGFAHCSLLSPMPGAAAVFGTDGWIEVPPRFHHPTKLRLHPLGPDGRAGEPQAIAAPPAGIGYVHELDEVHRCLAAGVIESPAMPLDDTVAVMQVLEHALHALGIHYDEGSVEL